jgi:hypothetical protein
MKNLAAVCITLAGLVACSGVGEKRDSTKIVPVEDMNAKDTLPPLPPARVTKLAILDDSVPEGGVCNIRRYRPNADQAREVFYETVSPSRTYILEIGKGLRMFGPVSIDMRATQTTADLTETENVYAGFSANGRVTVGTRRYSASGSQTVNDRMSLDFTDSAKVLAIATKIIQKCDQ